MEASYQEITLGIPVCVKLKAIYFRDAPWAECYRDVAAKLSQLKAILKQFYGEKTTVEVMKELLMYNDQGIMEAFEHG